MKIDKMMGLVVTSLRSYSKVLSTENKGIKILEFNHDGIRRFQEIFPGNDYETLMSDRKESYYDLIIYSMGIHKTWDFKRSLEECFLLLKPGGHLIVDCPMDLELQQDQPDFWRITPIALTNLLDNCGFSHGQISLWDDVLTSGMVRKPK